MFLAVISILTAIAIYATTQTADVITKAIGSNFEISPVTVIIVSTVVYIASLVSSSLATLIDNERLEFRYKSLQGEHKEDLRDTFRRLEQ